MRKTPLNVILNRHPPGTWVILDPTMSKVIGAGKTLLSAMKKAGISPTDEGHPSMKKRPVAMQVMDPKMNFFSLSS